MSRSTRYLSPSLPELAADAGDERVLAASRSVKPSRRTSRSAFFEEPPEEDDPLLGFEPYLHAAPRRNSITPDRQRAFIAALAASGIVTQAARSIGASLEALYKLRHRKGAEGFSAAWDAAIDRGMMRLEDCALERAIQGEVRPVVSMGQVVTSYIRHDTALMMFLLRTRRAGRFATVDPRINPQPGDALYEKVLADYRARQPSSEAVLDSINAKIEKMRERRLAHEAVLAQDFALAAEEEAESYCGA
ncbi:hypothetical protein [Novosphingobium sp. P6W]|uniref:hypothetical protein n=1 Tax=Novosphingobium sp. P6W TaxID=1609758 RepID=UPI000A693466|nr:hypothetical protein [Novosphingobium sp. P6W]